MASIISPCYRDFFFKTKDNLEMEKRDEEIVCFYHAADNDGKFSGNVVARAFEKNDKFFIGMNFEEFKEENMKHFIQMFPNVKKIFIVDYSFPPEVIDYFLSHTNAKIYWADHHITGKDRLMASGDYNCEPDEIIEKIYHKRTSRFIGYFSHNNKVSAVRMTYELLNDLFPERMKFVNEGFIILMNMVSTWDIFDKEDSLWEDAKNFNTGCRIYEPDLLLKEQNHPFSDFWQFCCDDRGFREEIIHNGEICAKYQVAEANNRCIKSLGMITFHGVTFFVLNTDVHGSNAFSEEVVQNAVALMTYFYVPAIRRWKFGLYAGDKATESLDLTKIAKIYGGGGHGTACGFVTEYLPFSLNEIVEI